jgi:putative redox protein
MPTSTLLYKGDLRTELTHLGSGNIVITDAPLDNKGRGEAFSPTDLVATALSSCMITIMGILAREHGFSIDGANAEITKVMAADPRRISEIHIKVNFPAIEYTQKQKTMLRKAAETCPVALSLHPEIKQVVEFVFLAQ